jgi:aminocarboxymuconate-semialdehyde decarboxylase
MRIVDFHNHYYPPEYVEALKIPESQSAVKVTYDDDGNPCVHYPGDYNILVPGHRDINYRQTVLDEHGVTTQVLSFTTPGVHVERPDVALAWSRMVNDAYARIMRERAGRFTALATLPLNDPQASVAELERAMKQLGLPGAMVFSNVNHVALADERFAPLWKKADELGAVIYIHPTDPLGVDAMLDYWLMPLVGFLFDTTLAASKLVFSGVVDRHPNIRWVLTHMGGAIPYLAERLDRGHRAFAECRRHITRPPSEYLRQFYFDTVNFDPSAVRLALDFAGEDHILAGSDYPHQIGSIPLMLETIRGLDVADSVKQKILAGNASKLLGLRGGEIKANAKV